MTESDSTTGSAIPEELAGVQSQLEKMMGSADDKTKKLIFNRLVRQLAEVLPETPPESFAKEPKPISASTQNLLDATNKLHEAAYMAEFIQSISLNVPHDGAIMLQPGQVTGFYFVMQNTIARIKEAEVLIDTVRTQPEALPA